MANELPLGVHENKFTGPEQPDNLDISIWRYMDFAKFISLLEDRALVFSRREGFNDPYEGAYTHVPLIYPEHYSKFFTQEQIDSKRHISELDRQIELQWFFINCWHMNETESEAMWKLYSDSNRAICIQSSYRVLKDLLPVNATVGKVHYLDYDKDLMPGQGLLRSMVSPFFHKRKAFEHEREIRAVIRQMHPMEPNRKYSYDEIQSLPHPMIVKIQVDLNQLIQQVLVAPTAPRWFNDLVGNVLKRYELSKEVFQSSLDGKPTFIINKKLQTEPANVDPTSTAQSK